MIANLDFQQLGLQDDSEGIHFERLETLADLLGFEMTVHCHPQHLQLHYLLTGEAHFQIEDYRYHAQAPCCFVTPVAIPHAFVFSEDTQGFVLTLHQTLTWRLFKETRLAIEMLDNLLPACLVEGALSATQLQSWTHIKHTWQAISEEHDHEAMGKNTLLESLVRTLLTYILRCHQQLVSYPASSIKNHDITLFQRFTRLIEEQFKHHWLLPQYAQRLGVSETRLNQICQKIAQQPSKKLITARVLKEVKRQLIFTPASIADVSDSTGFSDPAYFARFFKQQVGETASGFRRKHRILER